MDRSRRPERTAPDASCHPESRAGEPRCRLRLAYDLDRELVDHRPEHEAWLLGWAIDCLDDDGVDRVDVDRTERAITTTVSVDVTTDVGNCLDGEKLTLGRQILRLACWTGDVNLACRPVDHRS